ncbi:MAG: M23 family metallopeptidase [Olivibacter sp.]|nr:M23 family metallopeptidase [Olivibacter sp. UJ_SKK_5.1]
MKYLIIALLQVLCIAVFAQGFNSVVKPLSLNEVAIRPNELRIPSDTVRDTIRMFVPDLLSKAALSLPIKSIPIEEQPRTISFSKPLAWLQKTSGYGYRFHPILKKWKYHSGVDLASNSDTVYSMLSGKVKDSGYSAALGNYVRTEHIDGKIELLYAHLSEYYYLIGETVSAGDPIGITGSTGRSTGDHLHLAVFLEGRHVDPLQFMSQILNFNNYQITNSNEQVKRKLNFSTNSDIRAGFAKHPIN